MTTRLQQLFNKKCCIGWLLIVMAGLVPASPVFAGWSGGVEGGTVIRDDGSATRLRLKAVNNARPLSHYLYVDWLRTENGDNSYKAGYIPRYWFTDLFYGFADISSRVDKPLGIDREQLYVAGVGVQLLANRYQSLWAQAGVGQRNTQFLNDLETDENLSLVQAGFNQVLADLIRFELDFDLINGEELTESTAEAGLSMRVPGGSVKVSYRTRRLDPDGGETVEDSDTFFSFNYGF